MSTPPVAFSIVNTISLLVIVSYIVWVPLWMFYPPTMVPPESLSIINQMMGAHGMAFATVIAFHLGSSRGSKDAQDATRDTLSTLSTSIAATASGTGNGHSTPAVVTAAAEVAAVPAAKAAAPAAAAEAAPPAAAVAAPPAAEAAAPAAAEKAVAEALAHEPKP